MANDFVLEMNHISKTYGSNTVLKDVTLSVRPGEIHALLGENGAGKSTLMNILFGMPVIHSTGGFQGEVFIDGQKTNIISPMDAMDKGIGMVHQEFMLIPGFHVTDNIKLNREITNPWPISRILGKDLEFLDRKAMASDARKALDAVGMNIEEYTMVSGLPVGHMQFIEIAREIDKKGMKLLVFDEPTAVLTESEAQQLLNVMKNIASQGIAIIFITHRLDEVMDAADRITILRDGTLVTSLDKKDATAEKLAALMIGRGDESVIKVDKRHTEIKGETAMTIRDMWVNMPGEVDRGIDLDIYEGEILGIGGLAGQGKIGVPNGVMGLYEASGEVTFFGHTLPLGNTRDALKAGLAMVSEDRRGVGLLLDQSIEDNIAFTAMQINGDFIRTPEVDRNVSVVSAVPAVREVMVALQRAVADTGDVVAEGRDIIIIDTAGRLHNKKQLVLETLVRLNREQGLTIVMVSSELQELRSICDRIAIVAEGKVVDILSPDASDIAFGLAMSGKKMEKGETV